MIFESYIQKRKVGREIASLKQMATLLMGYGRGTSIIEFFRDQASKPEVKEGVAHTYDSLAMGQYTDEIIQILNTMEQLQSREDCMQAAQMLKLLANRIKKEVPHHAGMILGSFMRSSTAHFFTFIELVIFTAFIIAGWEGLMWCI